MSNQSFDIGFMGQGNPVLDRDRVEQEQDNPVLNAVDLNALFQEMLGRAPDEASIGLYGSMSEADARAAIMASPEYTQRLAALSDPGIGRYVPTGPEGVGDIYGGVHRVWDQPWADYYRQARNDVEGIQRLPGVFSAYQNIPIAEQDIQQAFYPVGMQPSGVNPVLSLLMAPEDTAKS